MVGLPEFQYSGSGIKGSQDPVVGHGVSVQR